MTESSDQKGEYETKRAAFAAESAKFRDSTIHEIDFILSDITRFVSELMVGTKGYLRNREDDLRKVEQRFKERKMVHVDHERAWRRYQEVWDEIKRRKKQASFESKVHFQQKAGDIKFALKEHGPRVAMDLLKETQKARADYYLNKDDWDEVQRSLDEAFRVIQEARAQGREEHRDRLEKRIRQTREFLQRQEGSADRLRKNISENQSRRDSARSADFSATVQGWIDDGESDLLRRALNV
ncbi:hypothetical protein FJY68_12985 [candidate division WOR-3 bacterium]|uniref:Uncharacterized protein n=1 Tax=candidate division WOR-3 bacterium TaxID=2052148 RepID=A0A937XK03_UNCW3|nr:hypothetical protein [candidate division WOR-3 bacterium]